MFDLDKWQEILNTVRQNKLRTFLTAFSVSWGIFILMVLLGFGTGLQRGVEADFRSDATNSIWLRSGQTSLPYRGMKPGRNITMTTADFEKLRNSIPGIEFAAARFFCYGEFTVRYRQRFSSFNVLGITPEHMQLENQFPIKGRYLNEFDLLERRKVAIISNKVVETLFPNGQDPIGEWIDVRGILYKIVGVYDDQGGEGELDRIFIPLSTAQLAYNGTEDVHQVMFTVGSATVQESQAMAKRATELLSEKYRFDPEDKRALFVWNNVENYQRFVDLFNGIQVFLWIVGIGTIVAGIVGVSNIMLIVVKDRTREIGVRKAIGATPGSIIALFLQESIAITILAGYTGLLSGIGLIEAIRWALEEFKIEAPYFKNPEISLPTAISATLLLIIAGAMAGYFPARKAVRVNPIEALREE
jgi:putative ABC transport system permease protein